MLSDISVPRAGDARCTRLLCRPANAQRGVVRGLNQYLPLNCSNRSTSTKFGPLVAKVIYF